MLSRPSKGYGWTCAPCSRQHEDQVDSRGAPLSASVDAAAKNGAGNGGNGNGNGAPKPRGRGRPRKEKPGAAPAVKEEELAIKHYKLWPFRYFGCVAVPRPRHTLR